jgi:sigma-B regulation protein RsbU (phosphoserine phosphatase)
MHGDGHVAKLNPTSPICGAFRDAPFNQSETRLERGALLFLYTDGLVEARREGRLFGEDRLVETLRRCPKGDPAIHVRAALGDALSFAGGRLSDDLAVLAIERAEMPQYLPLQQKLPFDEPPGLD